eukprot:GHRR01027470.1.p1 GENE.GHRR01027470.1~~GHRR01027470.1.p1  ORF type:complete len:267 (+),score=120.11 GHRR01027470.1:1103-1903(+)
MTDNLLGSVNLGLVQLNCVKVRDVLLRKKEKLVGLLKALAARIPRVLLAAASAKFSELERQLKAPANSIEEVDAQRKFIGELPMKMAAVVAEVEAAKPWYAALESMRYLLPDDETRDKVTGQSWQVKLLRLSERTLEQLDVDQTKYADELTAQEEDFAGKINSVAMSLTNAQAHVDVAKVDVVAAEVAAVDKQLRAVQREALQLNTRQALLGQPLTDYSHIKMLIDMFDPFIQFWTAAASWKVRRFQVHSASRPYRVKPSDRLVAT